jgi:hypothetical protein
MKDETTHNLEVAKALEELGITAQDIKECREKNLVNSKNKSISKIGIDILGDVTQHESEIVAVLFFPEVQLSKKDMIILRDYLSQIISGNIEQEKVKFPKLLEVAEMISQVQDMMIHSVERKLEDEEQQIMDKLLSIEIGKKYVFQEMIKQCWVNVDDQIEGSIPFMLNLIKDNPEAKEYLIAVVIDTFLWREAFEKVS